MRALVIGGTGFIGRFVVAQLAGMGHRVTVFHRGNSSGELPGEQILGERSNLATHREDFGHVSPEVVIDMILSSERQARDDMEIFRGIAGRMVAISSMDVYRACGILHRREEGPIDNTPLTEDSPLRETLHPYGPAVLKIVRSFYSWVDEDYDKIPVERVIMNDPNLPGTVLRLPMVYGPGDPAHRLFPILKRVDDGRRVIPLEVTTSRFRGCRGYVENVAAAIRLAAVSPRASGRIYNVADPHTYTEAEWAEKVAGIAGWSGQVIALPADRAPKHLKSDHNLQQHWVPDTRRIREELGYAEAVPMEEALRRTIEWERANPPAQIDLRQFDYGAEDAALASAA